MTRKFFQKVAAIAMVLATLSLGAFAQNRSIHGTVVDGAGVPVIGATVMVVGNSNIGTVTDVDGAFILNVPANATISVSCIGYSTQTAAVGQQSEFSFILAEDTEFLEETVVIGYGVQKKSDLTGAVASVNSESLKALSTSDAAAALQGKAAGVNVINNGAPGSGSDIRVRGISSNGGNISPLYIVDGLQVSSIQYLDPSMIESIEILKDAASAAIYGAQAGNGVVLVTTKTGSDSKASVSYSGKATLQNYTKRPLMNRAEFIEYMNMALGESKVTEELKKNDYNHPLYDGGVIDTDWIGAYMEPTWSQQHSISVSGGNKNGHYFTSLNYVYNDGVVKGKKDVYERFTAQVNADYNLFKWLQVGTTNTIEKWSTQSVSQRGYGSSFESVIMLDPLTPVYWTSVDQMPVDFKSTYDLVQAGDPNTPAYRFLGDENGFFANTNYSDAEGSPLAKRDTSEGTNGGFNINGTMFANFMPIKGLTITSRLGYRLNFSNSHSYSSPYYIGGRGSSKTYSLSASSSNGYYYQWENFANYNTTIARKHNLGVMVGMSYRESHNDGVSGSGEGTNILNNYAENFRYLNYLINSDTCTKKVSNSPSQSASIAYFGRLTYNYDNRYSLQANFRADAFDSSKLDKNHRWGYFPSFSAGWTISNESFFKDNLDPSVFNFLKLRGSWGRNGNISVLGGYGYSSSISVGGSWYQFNVDQNPLTYGSAPGGLANPDLHWEIAEQLDFGLDARMFNNRLTFAADYFNKHTKDLLFNVSVPPELGVSSVTANGGDVLNRGLEFELSWRDRIGDFGYGISGNFSSLHNEVLSLAEGAAPDYRTDASSTNYKIRTCFEPGYSIWYLNGFEYAGLNENGVATYYDINGKVTTDPGDNDMKYLGDTTPKFMYGFSINLDYKGFDILVNGYGQGGNYLLPVFHRTGFKNNLTYYLDKTKDGTYPSADKQQGDYTFWSSTANLFKGDYFRIKQLQFGYTLPASLTKKAAISNLRLYVSLDDFFTITKYPGLDPETASTNSTTGAGLDWGSYPTMKKLIFGVNLTF